MAGITEALNRSLRLRSLALPGDRFDAENYAEFADRLIGLQL